MYYQVTGNVARDIERLDGDKVRVRFRKQDDSVNVKAFSASVGLNGAKLLPANALGSAVAPLVESVAQVGFKASVEKTKQNGSMFEVELDLSTPRGRAAMEHLLKNDLSEAQYWARYADSGVKLNSSVTTALNVNTKSANLNLAGLDAESMTRWIEKAKTELTPDSYTFTQALDYTQKSNHLLPWMPSRMSDVRFLNQREVAVDASAMPPVGEAPAVGAPMTMRVAPPEPVATLANSRALLGVRVKITDSKSSLRDVNDTLGAAVNVMDAVGYTPEAYKRFSDFRTAVNAGIVPQKKPLLLGLGDKRFGETSLDLEGYVGPQGLKTMFSRPDGMGRSRDDYNHAYLQAAGLTGDGSVASDAGLRAAIEKKLHVSLVPQSAGGYSVVKEGTAIGTLSPADFAALRKTVDDFAPPMASDERPNWYQEVQAKVGTWVGKPPRALFDLDSQKWAEVTTTRGRASAFSDAMEKAAALSAENSPSNPTPGPLFDKPEAYFGQLNELFEKTVHNDGNHQTAALTLLTLAGKDGIYTRAAFTVPKETAGQMIDTARSAVQRFGAATLLADRQPALNAAGAFEFATGSDPAAATKLAQAMFGPGVKVQSSDGRTMVSDIAMTPERKEGLMTLLTAGRGADGSLQVPSKWSPAQTSRFIKDALGAPTVVSGGRIAFDNHGYQGVSIGDALSSFGPEAFGTHAPGKGPPLFAVSAPIENEHVTQDPSAYLQFMVAKHKGVNSGWGAAFEGMAFMRTRQADLSRAEPLATGWVLTD